MGEKDLIQVGYENQHPTNVFRSNVHDKPHVQHTQPEEEEKEELFLYLQVLQKTPSSSSHQEKHYNVLDLVKTPNIRIITVALCLTW